MSKFRSSALRIVPFFLVALIITGCFAGAKKSRIRERADSYFKAKEYDKAKVEYLNLLRLDQREVISFQQLGFIWLEQGAPLRAIPFLNRARELAPQNIVARAKLASAYMTVGDASDARKEAMAVLQQDPANSDSLIILCDTAHSKEDIAAAEQQIEKFPSKDAAAFHLAAASLANKKGNLGAAADEIQKAIAAEPKSARAHLAMGYMYLLRENKSHAGPELKAASDLASVRSEERIKYAEFRASQGASDEAKTLLQAVTKQAPDYLPAWRDLAQIALGEKKYDEGLSLLENVVSRDPENPEARLLQSQLWLSKGDSGKAIAILDKINAAYPNNPLVKYQLAGAYLASKNPAQAAAAFEQAIATKPDYTQAILALAELNLQSGKAQAVVSTMEELLKKHPDLRQARLLLANAYRVLGRLDDAAALFREEIKNAPESADGYFLLGQTLRQQKKNDEARQAFEKASELRPDDFNPVDQLVEMDLSDKRYDAAAQRVQEQLQKHPNTAGVHLLEAKVYITHAGSGDWAKAEEALQKAIKLNPNITPAYELLVSVYVSENKLSEAIRQLDAEHKTNPEDPRPVLVAAMIYERMKDYPKARDAYEKVLAANPNSLLALNNLAYLYAQQLDQLDKGYELAQKARTLQPGDAMVEDTLGWILYKRGDYQQALGLIQESATKFPDNPEVQFHLGMTSYMMGHAEAARAALERAVHAAVEFQGKEEAQRRLAQLQNLPAGQGQSSTGKVEAGLKEQPNDLMTLIRSAEEYEKQGDLARAASAYEQAFKVNPKLASSALKLAQLYSGPLRQPAKAFEFAKKARELAPTDPRTAGIAGRVAYQAGNYTWAYSLLQESARHNASDASILHDLGMTVYFLGKVAEARQTMQRALDAKLDATQTDDAKRFLAMTALDRPAEAAGARNEIDNVLKTEPDYLPALMARAAGQLQSDDKKAAAGIYEDALRKYPDFAPANKRLAAIYAEDPQNLAKAYELAMKARKTLSDDPELARTLAEVSFKRKEFAYAVQLFQQTAEKESLSATDLYYLGMAQLQSRQESKGRESLKRALAAGLQDPLAQEAKQRLAEEKPK